MVEVGGVRNAYRRRRIYAAAEENGGVIASSLGRTRTMAEGNGARGACSLRRNFPLAEGNRASQNDSLHRHCTVIICNRRRRRPWARNRGIICNVIGQAGNWYTSTLRNKRRFVRQCCRRTGRICRIAVELSSAGAEGSWLARVRVSSCVVGSPKAHSRRISWSRRGRRGWDTTMVVKHLWVTGVTAETTYWPRSWWYPRN